MVKSSIILVNCLPSFVDKGELAILSLYTTKGGFFDTKYKPISSLHLKEICYYISITSVWEVATISNFKCLES